MLRQLRFGLAILLATLMIGSGGFYISQAQAFSAPKVNAADLNLGQKTLFQFGPRTSNISLQQTVIQSSYNGGSPSLGSIHSPPANASAAPQLVPRYGRPGLNSSSTSTSPLDVSASISNFATNGLRAKVAPNSIGPFTVTPTLSFDGLQASQNVPFYGGTFAPPDTEGDVGPNNYVQSVNTAFAVWDRGGNLLAGPFPEQALFAAAGLGQPCGASNDNGGDPIVLYDSLADRWLFTYLAYASFNFGTGTGTTYLCVAVSKTGNPLGAWWLYIFAWPANLFPDYPKYGVWPDAYYASVNQYCGTGLNSWCGAAAVAFQRVNMLTGAAAIGIIRSFPISDVCDFSLLPSDLDGPAPPSGTANTYAELIWPSGTCGFNGVALWNFKVNFGIPSASTFTNVANLVTAPFDPNMCNFSRNCIPQQGTADGLDAISGQLMNRLQYRNFGSYASLVAEDTVDATGADQAGIQWYELRNYGSGWSLYQQGTYAPDSKNRWMGSIAMDSSGDIALCYSLSTGSMYPSIACTGRLASDPLGQMTVAEFTIVSGTGSQTDTGNRWGDYSMLAVDPIDDHTFWYTQEYYVTTGSFNWSTRIAAFSLAPCVLCSVTIPLNAGWNLVSLSLIPSNPTTSALLSPLIVTGNLVVVWGFTGTPRTWKFFSPPASGTLTTMTDGNGYWIYVKAPSTLAISGYIVAPSLIPPTYPLPVGWSLVGFKPQPAIQSETIGQYLTSLAPASYDSNNIWIFDNANQVWIHATLGTTIKPGEAFWILMISAATLTPQ